MKIKGKKLPKFLNSFQKRIWMLGKSADNKINKFIKKLPDVPPVEDVVYVLFFSFSLAFGAMLFGIGKQIKNEKISAETVRFPNQLERDITKLAGDYPIRSMARYISLNDRDVAAYLVAIAKKESNWGKYSPKKGQRECYNYWGYRGTYNQTRSGYSCFDSPDQAVAVVGKRLSELIDQDIDTPPEMVVWKCGATCDGHDPEAVAKWISDVDFYFRKF